MSEHTKPIGAVSRFWGKVDKSTHPKSCWVWTGCTRGGYGRFRVSGRHESAHRFSFEIHNGPIPEGQLVCHRCDNPPCCNPAHLFLGTYKDNNVDRENKGRGNRPVGDLHPSHLRPETRPRGEAHSSAKLTDAQVVEIRQLGAEGVLLHREIAARFGVSRANISYIIRGVTRRGLPK